MVIFIRNVPRGTLPSMLRDFVAPALRGGLFSNSGHILEAKILAIKDKQSDAHEFHGLVSVDSDSAGKRAIQRLKGRSINGVAVKIHEYAKRDWHNDRRSTSVAVAADVMEKRRKDRRRGSGMEIIEDIASIWDVFSVPSSPSVPAKY